jgi:hypothetical protein
MIGEDYLAEIIKNHLEELDWILLDKKPSRIDQIQKLIEQEKVGEIDKGKLDEISKLLAELKEEKRNDKDIL